MELWKDGLVQILSNEWQTEHTCAAIRSTIVVLLYKGFVGQNKLPDNRDEILPDNCTYVWWLAGRLVTLHTRYFLFIWPQWVTSTFRPGATPTMRGSYEH